MFLNNILSFFQNKLSPIYNKSFFLQNIDWLIGANILLVILSSTIAPSDYIGYFAIFAIILTAVKLLTKTGEKFELSWADKLLLIYFLFVVISVAGSSLLYLSLKGFFKTFTYLGFYVSLVHYFKDNRDKIKYIFWAYALCVAFETVVAFLQNFASVDEISGWQDTSRLNPEEVMTRVYGTLKPYNPNLFGGYMLACIPALITLPKKYGIPLALLASVALVLTGCRGSYIGYFFQILLLVAVLYKFLEPKFKKMFATFVASAGALIFCFMMSISALRARIFSIFAMRSDSSNSFRFNVYNSCIDMFKDNWLLGIGVGNQNFREIYGLYMKTGFDALSAYNIYLETAVESGIFALLAFLGFIILIIKYAIKNLKNIYVLTALVSIVGILLHGFVDTVFFRPQIQFTFWIMVATIRGYYDTREN